MLVVAVAVTATQAEHQELVALGVAVWFINGT
jgi:hypothetical protein